VIDVGAHVGETALRFSEVFREARIYSFEPDPANYAELVAGTRRCQNITPVQRAVAESDGEIVLHRNRFSQTHSLLRPSQTAGEFLVSAELLEPIDKIAVLTTSLDHFCEAQGVTGPDVLKIDAQGAEIRVLEGARALLARRAIPLIFLEVNFVPLYEESPLFPEVYQYLYDRGYRLVGFYDAGLATHYYQVSCNALFVEEAVGRRRDR
jgi:FkbM family methyltransferase